jgi:hypothetical protein
MKALIKYLFPKLRDRDKLPLLPLEWSSSTSRHGRPDSELANHREALKSNSLARTDQDADRLLRLHKDKPINEVIQIAKRNRRREPRLKRALRRLKRLW